MFRALLWKEWRELWILPAAAVPLAAIGYWLAGIFRSSLSPWDIGFTLLLCAAAVYIPSHLFAQERELNRSQFLQSMPVDSFRLWWFRIFMGLMVLISVAVVLATVVGILSFLYSGETGMRGIAETLAMSIMLFSLSSLFSAFMKRQLSAIVCTALLVPFFVMIWGIRFFSWIPVFRMYSFPKMNNYPVIVILILPPLLLLASLALFAKGNVWKRTKKHIALAYAPSAVIALVPVAFGFSYLFEDAEKLTWSWNDEILVRDISADATRLVLRSGGKRLEYPRGHYSGRLSSRNRPGPLIHVDLAERRIRTLDIEQKDSAHDVKGEKVILKRQLRRSIFPDTIALADFEGGWEKNLHTGRWFDFKDRSNAEAHWSVDGNYISLIKYPSENWKEDGSISILDSDGNILGEQAIPLSEKIDMYWFGWDYDQRFYFSRTLMSPSPRTICQRFRPDNMIPEEVPFLSGDGYFSGRISPDGSRILIGRADELPGEWKYWIYDISHEKAGRLDSETMSESKWSSNGRTLACVYESDPPPGVASAKIQSKRPSVQFYNLSLYDVETGERRSVLTEPVPNLNLLDWSPSGEYLLFKYPAYEHSKGNRERVNTIFKLNVASAEIGLVSEIADPASEYYTYYYRYYNREFEPHWISENRLVWSRRWSGKLIATDIDGSNPQEIFRVKDGKFYLYGEEQT
jgi:hypothetical protein